MTTDDVPAPNRPASFTLDEGPLHDALVGVDRALSDIEYAKSALTERRHDFARVFQSEVAARAGDDSLVTDLREVIRARYWEHPTLRMSDLSAATGLGAERIRRIAGSRVVEMACTGCGTPTEVLQTRRSERVPARCVDCRRPEPVLAPDADPWPATAPTGPAPAGGATWLDRLVEHLDARLRAVDCDNQLTLTRRWAMREGLDQDAVADRVRRLGGFCDCEVVMNAPPNAGSRPW